MRMSPLIPLTATDGTYGGIYVTSNNLGNATSPFATHNRAADDYGKSTRIIGIVYADIDITVNFFLLSSSDSADE